MAEAATESRIMSDPTREEIDAKLAAVEARTETRFTELNGKIDRLADSISALGSTVASLKSDIADVKADNRYTRWTIIVTVIASALAAIAALWVTQANLLAAFSAGIAVRTETRESSPSTPSRPALRPDAH
jgi:non-ribosomal peptide synthetase component E (peptide arylation enzyme)